MHKCVQAQDGRDDEDDIPLASLKNLYDDDENIPLSTLQVRLQNRTEATRSEVPIQQLLFSIVIP